MNERGRRRITRKRERREKDRKSGPIAATAQTTVTPLEFTTTRTYTRSRQSRPLAHNFSLSLLRASGKYAHSVASRCTRAVLYSRATGSAIVCLSSSSRGEIFRRACLNYPVIVWLSYLEIYCWLTQGPTIYAGWSRDAARQTFYIDQSLAFYLFLSRLLRARCCYYTVPFVAIMVSFFFLIFDLARYALIASLIYFNNKLEVYTYKVSLNFYHAKSDKK